MKQTNDTKINGIFHFHGLNLPIWTQDKQDFVPLKPITDLIGIQWQRAKKSLESEYKTQFYQFCLIVPPPIAGLGILKYKETACILLKKVHFYLAQINPERIQANGNIEAAQFLTQLHDEWAQALHDYESYGAAFKSNHQSNLKELLIMRKNAVGTEKQRLTFLIEQQLDEMGCPEIPEPQQNLPI